MVIEQNENIISYVKIILPTKFEVWGGEMIGEKSI